MTETKINFDIVMVVISSRGDIYNKLIEIYWLPIIEYIRCNKIPIKIILLFGKDQKVNDLPIPSENIFISDVNDSVVPGILFKTVQCFNDIENKYNYKHIIRTNLSSFFIIDNLLEIQKSLDNSGIYAGVLGEYNGGRGHFCSGACFWITKDVLNTLIHSDLKSVQHLNDDVAISIVLKQYDRKCMPRYPITSDKDIENKELLIHQIIKNNHYHIRIKNERNRNLYIKYFKCFYDLLYK